MFFSRFIPRQLCHYLGNLWAETPLPRFFPLSIIGMCCLGLQEPLSLILLANLPISSSPPVVAFSVQSLSVSVSCFVSACLHPPPSRPLGIPKSYLEQKSLLGSPRALHFGVVIPISGQTGNLHFSSKVPPSTFFQVPLSFSPPLIWERMFLEEGNLIPPLGLNKRENADNSEEVEGS